MGGVILFAWIAAMFVVVWVAGYVLASAFDRCDNGVRVCEPWLPIARSFVWALVLGPAAGILMRRLTRRRTR